MRRSPSSEDDELVARVGRGEPAAVQTLAARQLRVVGLRAPVVAAARGLQGPREGGADHHGVGAEGVLDDAAEQRIAAAAEDVATALRDGMNADVEIDPLELFRHVYTEQTPQLAEQEQFLAAELAREETGQ